MINLLLFACHLVMAVNRFSESHEGTENGQLVTFKYLLWNNIAGKETNISVSQASEYVCSRRKKLYLKK